MKKRLFLPVLLVGFIILCSSALAQEQGDGAGGGNSRRTEAGLESGSAGGDNAEGDQLQTRKKIRTREQVCDPPCYEGKDGEKCEWRYRYNRRLVKYEKEGDNEALNKYLYRIAHRYTFRKSEDKEGFVKWAHENRPWNIESH